MEISAFELSAIEDVLDEEELEDEIDYNSKVYEVFDRHATVYHQAMLERIAPPEVEIPLRSCILRSEENLILYKPSIEQGNYRISEEASKAWLTWMETFTCSPEDIFFDKQEKDVLIEYEKEMLLETKEWIEDELSKAYRVCSESHGFNRPLARGEECYMGIALDCCKGKTTIKELDGISVGDIAKTSYKQSIEDRLQEIIDSNFETTIRRKPVGKEIEDLYYPNTGMSDDPDYISTSESSRNYAIAEPIKRTYNTTFEVTFRLADGSTKTKIVKPDRTINKDYLPVESFIHQARKRGWVISKEDIKELDNDIVEITCKLPDDSIKVKTIKLNTVMSKDYTTATSLIYLAKTKGWTLTKEDIKEIDNPALLPGREIDLRITYDTKPDPVNYKKIDPESEAGIKFLQILNDDPYRMREFIWNYSDPETNRTERKLAYGMVIPEGAKGNDITAVYWVYIKDSFLASTRPVWKYQTEIEVKVNGEVKKKLITKTSKGLKKKRVIPPQISDIKTRYLNGDDITLCKVLRISKYFRTDLKHSEILEHYFVFIQNSDDVRYPELGGFKLLSGPVPESPYSDIMIYKFVRFCINSKEDYKKALLGPSYSKRLEYQEGRKRLGLPVSK